MRSSRLALCGSSGWGGLKDGGCSNYRGGKAAGLYHTRTQTWSNVLRGTGRGWHRSWARGASGPASRAGWATCGVRACGGAPPAAKGRGDACCQGRWGCASARSAAIGPALRDILRHLPVRLPCSKSTGWCGTRARARYASALHVVQRPGKQAVRLGNIKHPQPNNSNGPSDVGSLHTCQRARQTPVMRSYSSNVTSVMKDLPGHSFEPGVGAHSRTTMVHTAMLGENEVWVMTSSSTYLPSGHSHPS